MAKLNISKRRTEQLARRRTEPIGICLVERSLEVEGASVEVRLGCKVETSRSKSYSIVPYKPELKPLLKCWRLICLWCWAFSSGAGL